MKSLPVLRSPPSAAPLAGAAAAADWPSFRGPTGMNTSDDSKIPTKWDDDTNLRWKLDLPGKGFSSPIVVGDKVFVTCWSGDTRDLSKLERHLVCVDRNKGKVIWKKAAKAVLPEFRSGGSFSYHGYASSTPCSDGERVYTYYGTTGLLAYDLKGNKLWQKSCGTGQRTRFGSASSPILYKNLVIATAGAESTAVYA